MNRTTALAHRASIALMAVGVLIATVDGFAQSYAGLYRWAVEHHLSAWKAQTFPLLVDVFIAVGELGLFALALEGHRLTRRGLSWADIALPFSLAAGGWGVSLAFNVGAVGDDVADRLTAAVAPVASMLGLLVMLRTVHRLVTRTPDREELEAWPLPHLDDQPDEAPALTEASTPELPPGAPVPETESAPDTPNAVPEAVLAEAREKFAPELAAGRVPGIRPIKAQLRVGQPRAGEVQAYLATLVAK